MQGRITWLTGPRTGESLVLDKAYVTIGRHPMADIRFSPDEDLTVSGRHAAILLRDGVFLLRDLGSTNGTLVNGHRLTGEHVLGDRDQIQLGANGPALRFGIIWKESPSVAAAPTVSMEPPAPAAAPARLRPTPALGVPRTPTVVRQAVRQRTRSLRWTAVALGGALLLVTAAAVWQQAAARRRLTAEREGLLRRADSLLAALTAVTDTGQAIRTALAGAESETGRLRAEIESAGRDREALRALEARMRRTAAAQARIAGMAALDAAAITRDNADAVALLLVEHADGRRFTGTAFAVESDARGGWLLTSAHVVRDSAGTLASRLGVVFNGSNQNFRARVAAVHPALDLALLRVEVARGVPVVRALADQPPAAGEAAVLIGYPLGLDLPMGGDWREAGVSTTTTRALVAKVLPRVLQLDGFGAEGASGSPVFDERGRVVGILSAGETGSGGRVLFAVPASAAAALLAEARRDG